jgi:RNA polymerase sigma-70 factor, ECF subfamily
VTHDTEPAVEAAFEAGQRAWPGLALALEPFATHLRTLNVPAHLLPERAADLYIAAACTTGDERAVRRFEAQYLAGAESYVHRLHLTPEQVVEVCQRARIAILVGARPLIGRYLGRGSLAAWVRVIVVRTGLALARTLNAVRRKTDEDALDRLVAPGLGPEVGAIKERYRERLQDVLKQALSTLDDHEKTLLRLHFLDGLSVEAIARIYRVHRATASRWMVTLRNRVLQQVRAALSLPGKATSSELRSLINLLQSELELSLHRILA